MVLSEAYMGSAIVAELELTSNLKLSQPNGMTLYYSSDFAVTTAELWQFAYEDLPADSNTAVVYRYHELAWYVKISIFIGLSLIKFYSQSTKSRRNHDSF